MNLEVGDLVLCTVDRIVGTVVFVKIENDGEGSIVTSEIAPGRIRNLRDYVVPKKKIVCKVLRISSGGNIELSLRRVSLKEKKEVIEMGKQDKSYSSILKGILGDRAEEIINKIKERENIPEFLQHAKENPKLLEEFIDKKSAEKILEILNSQKQKKKEIKKEILFSTTRPDGIELIKEILGNVKDIEVKYLSAGHYSLKTESANPKQADNMLKEILSRIEKEAKKKDIDFSVK
jgi:translation initiation factor 2 alpha subunit (eIF-2alpha)